MPIGVFDSGLGGLTVVRQLKKILPNEDIVYFGDTGRVPYGTRSSETIHKYTIEDVNLLRKRNVKMIIAACGTVSSVAKEVLDALPLPSTGVVIPACEAAVDASKSGRIGIIATSASINSNAFKNEIMMRRAEAVTFQRACPMLVPLVENGWIDRNDKIARLIVERYLSDLKEQNIDTLILGCTHFPLIDNIIGDFLGENVILIDTGKEAAKYTKRILEKKSLLSQSNSQGKSTFLVSDRTDDFSKLAGIFLDSEAQYDVEYVHPQS